MTTVDSYHLINYHPNNFESKHRQGISSTQAESNQYQPQDNED